MGLVISRKVKQGIFIKRGDRVIAEVEIKKVSGETVWLHIDADENLRITRDKEWGEKRLDQKIPVSGVHDQI